MAEQEPKVKEGQNFHKKHAITKVNNYQNMKAPKS